jgi:hypothetical protein
MIEVNITPIGRQDGEQCKLLVRQLSNQSGEQNVECGMTATGRLRADDSGAFAAD